MSFRFPILAVLLSLGACSDSNDSDTDAVDDTGAPAPADANARYLADNAARAGVTVTTSGLQHEVLRPAEGARPGPRNQVTIHYVGTRMDGTQFDSSVARGEPISVPVDGIVPGLQEGVQLMSVGSSWRFVLPPELGYGDAGAGTEVAPDTVLIFTVDLLEINSM